MLWILLIVLLLLWILKFGLAFSSAWIIVAMAGTWLFLFGSMLFSHDRH